MKVYEDKSDRKAEVVVKADDIICDEFNHSHDARGTYQTCFIPLEHGQKISVAVDFKGSVKLMHLDLVVDGMLRNTKQAIYKQVRKTSKREEFGTALYGELKSTRLCRRLMRVARLNDVDVQEGTGTESVGLIELRICLQRSNDIATHDFTIPSFDTTKVWQDHYDPVEYRGLPPRHEISLAVSGAEPLMLQPKSARFKRTARAARPGASPWAVFRFYYRTRAAIQKAEFVPANPVCHLLMPVPITPGPVVPQANATSPPSTPLKGTSSDLFVTPDRDGDHDSEVDSSDVEDEEDATASVSPSATRTSQPLSATRATFFPPSSSPTLLSSVPPTSPASADPPTNGTETVQKDPQVKHEGDDNLHKDDHVNGNGPSDGTLAAAVMKPVESASAKRAAPGGGHAAKKAKLDATLKDYEAAVEEKRKVLAEKKKLREQAQKEASEIKHQEARLFAKRRELELLEASILEEDQKTEEAQEKLRHVDKSAWSFTEDSAME